MALDKEGCWRGNTMCSIVTFQIDAFVPLCAAPLWTFLLSPESARLNKMYRVLKVVEDDMRSSYWANWLLKAGHEREALVGQALAHAVIGRTVARDAQIPGVNMSWGDAEIDGFLCLTGSCCLESTKVSCARVHTHLVNVSRITVLGL